MTENLRVVLIGELIASAAPEEILAVYGLGSCVAVTMYDPALRIGGMIHALLPAADGYTRGNPAKFADSGVRLLLEKLLALGAQRERIVATLTGGAQMLVGSSFESRLNIGKRNLRAAEVALKKLGLRLQARATGGRTGRTVKFYIADGKVTVKTIADGERTLYAAGGA